MDHARRVGEQLALIFFNFDRFRIVNEGYGRGLGDRALIATGEKLADVLRDGDAAARVGGDEFLVLLTRLSKPGDAAIPAQRIIDMFREPIDLGGSKRQLSASIGVSVYPEHGHDPATLIANASYAMQIAKAGGGGNFEFFTELMREAALHRVELETQLRGAIAEGQLFLEYQPRVDIASGRITGCEALARWNHPRFGLIPPAEFIPVAEEAGLIGAIGEWVLHTACAQNRAWQTRGATGLVVSVNVSTRQFLQQDVVSWVMGALESTGLAPEMLELEITESLMANDPKKIIAAIDRLRSVGVTFSIDDFGTGYSSLSYLKDLQVDALKIDQSFIQSMLTQPSDAAIALAIISLAHSLKIRVVAEGVETAEQLEFLRGHDCDEVQGFYSGRPMSAQEFEGVRNAQLQTSDTAC